MTKILFSTCNGVYYLPQLDAPPQQLLQGKYYGLSRYKDAWLVARSNNKGERNHLVNNRLSDVSMFRIDEQGRLTEHRRIIEGIPSELHQICYHAGQLLMPHTGYNQVLYYNENQIESSFAAALGYEQAGRIALYITAPSHLNSIFMMGDRAYLIAHNYTLRTGRYSDLVVLDMPSGRHHVVPLHADSAHNFYRDTQQYLYFDSNRCTAYRNGKPFFVADKLLRGLAHTDEHWLFGGSVICPDDLQRHSTNPSLYLLDKQSGELLVERVFEGLGDFCDVQLV